MRVHAMLVDLLSCWHGKTLLVLLLWHFSMFAYLMIASLGLKRGASAERAVWEAALSSGCDEHQGKP